MSNTTRRDGKFIEITGLDTDWYLDQDMLMDKRDGLKVREITFFPSADGDQLAIKNSADGTAAAPLLCFLEASDTGNQRLIKSFGSDGEWIYPFIDIGDCTFNTAASCKVLIELT